MAIENILGFILNIDKYIGNIIEIFGPFSYLILFLIIFLETGLVITPFLPGDSLLFVVGAFAAQGYFNVVLMFFLLTIAAIIGDSLNYLIGNYFGVSFFEKSRFFKKEYLEKTKQFYRKYGGKTIFLARFIPIIRTFAPFVAGVGKMPYKRFLVFNITGGITWIALFLFAGYFFGAMPIVKENFSIMVIAIIIASTIPIIVGLIRNIMNK